MRTIIIELLDQHKATYKYLSCSKSEFSYMYASEERKKSLMGITATKNEAKSVLGGETANIQRYGRINLSGAGAVGDMKRNAFLYQTIKSTIISVKALGQFHQFDQSLQQAIILTEMTDAPATQAK